MKTKSTKLIMLLCAMFFALGTFNLVNAATSPFTLDLSTDVAQGTEPGQWTPSRDATAASYVARSATIDGIEWRANITAIQSSAIWLGHNNAGNRDTLAFLNNAFLPENRAAAIATVLSANLGTTVEATTPGFIVLAGLNNIANVGHITAEAAVANGATEMWILYTTDNGLTYNMFGQRQSFLQSSGLSIRSELTFTHSSVLPNAQFAFVLRASGANMTFRAPVFQFMEQAPTTPTNEVLWTFNSFMRGLSPDWQIPNATVSALSISRAYEFSIANPSNTPNASGGNNIFINAHATETSTVEFTITPDAGYAFDLNSISFLARRLIGANGGAGQWSLRSSRDAFEGDIVAPTGAAFPGNAWTLLTANDINIQNNMGAVTFRITLIGANAVTVVNTNIDDLRLGITTFPIPPTIIADATPIDFDMQSVGGTYPSQELDVTSINLTANITWELSGDNPSAFDVTPTYLPSAGGTFHVSFDPQAAGDYSATLILRSTGASDVTINLLGEALGANDPLLRFAYHTELTFANTLVGQTSTAQTATVNAGNLDGNAISVSLHYGTHFNAVPQTAGDFTNGTGGLINITFDPEAAGTLRDTVIISVVVDSETLTDRLPLVGEGVAVIGTAPVATAENVLRTRFTADWTTAVAGATSYTIHVYEGATVGGTAVTGSPFTVSEGTATYFVVAGLTANTQYTFTVTAHGGLDQTVTSSPVTFTTMGFPAQRDIIISQIYTGGGNASAHFNRRFVELFNRTDEPISLDGLFIGSMNATGMTNNDLGALSGTVPPRGFFLISGNSGGATGIDFTETPDIHVDGLITAQGGGKIVLSTQNTFSFFHNDSLQFHNLAGVLDLVAYGTGLRPVGISGVGGTSNVNSFVRNVENCQFVWTEHSVTNHFTATTPPILRTSDITRFNFIPAVVATTTLDPRELDFENHVRENEELTLPFTLTLSCLESNVTFAVTGDSEFTVYPTSIAQGFFGDTIIRVTFAPEAVDDFAGTLQIRGTDINIDIALLGTSISAYEPTVEVDPTSINFGGVLIATTTEPQTIEVTTEFVDGPLTVEMGGANAARFSYDAALLNTEGTLTVTFNPLTAELYTATLTVRYSPTVYATVTLTGTGVSTQLALNVADINIENVAINAMGRAFLTATGSHLQGDVTVLFEGGDAAMFSVSNNPFAPEADGSLDTTFFVAYMPTEAGPHSTTLVLRTEGIADVTIPITGATRAGVEAIAMWTFTDPSNPAIERAGADFGTDANLGNVITTSANITAFVAGDGHATSALNANTWNQVGRHWEVRVSTQGYENILVSSKQSSSATGPGDFVLQYSLDGVTFTDVSLGDTIRPGLNPGAGTGAPLPASGIITDVALPSSVSNQDEIWVRWSVATMRQQNNATMTATGGTNRITDILFVGTPTPFVAATRTEIGFGQIIEGETSLPQTVVISGINLEGVISHNLIGGDADYFEVTEVDGEWTAANGGTLSIVFMPEEVRAHTATLEITSLNASPVLITLTGEGMPYGTPTLHFNYDSLGFGEQYILTESAPRNIIVSAANLTDLAFHLTGDYEHFNVVAGTFPMATGGTFTVSFEPETAGTKRAYLVITSEELTDSIILKGTGVVATLANVADVDFGRVIQGLYATRTIQISGTHLQGNVTLALSGADAAMFDIDENELTPTDYVLTNVPILITYSPTTLGTHTAILTISSQDAQDVVVNLTGYGDREHILWTFNTNREADRTVSNVTASEVTSGARNSSLSTTGNTDEMPWPNPSRGSNLQIQAHQTIASYFEFVITPDAGFEFTLENISFGFRRAGTGATTWALRSSKDNFVANIVSRTETITDGVWYFDTKAVSNFTSDSETTFRIVLLGATTTGTPNNNRIEDLRLDVSASVIPPTIRVSTDAIAFSPQEIGTTSDAQTITVTGINLQLPIAIIDAALAPNFTATEAQDWDLYYGGTITITFAPTTAGQKRAVLYFYSDDQRKDSVVLTGTGVDPTSICPRDIEETTVVLFPNPVVDVLNIISEQAIATVRIYNLAGQLVVHGNRNYVDMSTLPRGTYVVRIVFENGTILTRTVVK